MLSPRIVVAILVATAAASHSRLRGGMGIYGKTGSRGMMSGFMKPDALTSSTSLMNDDVAAPVNHRRRQVLGRIQVRSNGMSRRRQALNDLVKAPVVGIVALETARMAAKADSIDAEQIDVYFGCGCFWHVQHEFIEMEEKHLGRNGKLLTSLTGYAGGKKLGDRNRVCYHNMRQVADYGRLGHAEVVGMKIPTATLYDFAKRYFQLFVKYDLPGVSIVDRADPQDKGPEYRSLLGLPGGVHSAQYVEIQRAMKDVLGDSWTLMEGSGNEPDTLLQRRVYVMDSSKFPFYRAEMYHQFHNDFQSPPYGKEYNSLRDTFKEASLISEVPHQITRQCERKYGG